MAQPTLTDDEVETFLACIDTVAPSVAVEELRALAPHLADDVSAEVIAAYAAEIPSQNPLVREDVRSLIPSQMPPAKLKELKMVLNLLR